MEIEILSGLPGSGKSTWCRNRDSYTVSTDNFFMKDGKYIFDPAKLTEAHGVCFAAYLKALAGDVDVIVDNTNIQVWEMSPYILAAQALRPEKRVTIVEFVPQNSMSSAQWVDYCASRTVHGVPKFAIERMWRDQRDRRLLPWWKSQRVEVGT